MNDLLDLTTFSTPKLLRIYAEILAELRTREVLRSSNIPTGDYGEFLFKQAYGWVLESNSASGHDATDQDGFRYQIKCRRITDHNRSRQLSFIRDLPDKPFDFLAGLLFDQHFCVLRAALVPIEVVKEHATYIKHVNGWRFVLRDTVWDIPDVQDVTHKLKAVEAAL